MLTLSQKERDRLVVLRQVAAGDLSVAEGGRRLGVTTRHMRRLIRRFEHDSDRVVVHGLKGRPSNRRLSVRLRERALELARDPLYGDFGPTLLAEHLGRTGEWEAVRPATLRLWLIEEGLWRPRKRGKQHRCRRERRAAFGELVLMDTSIHAWLEARSSEEIVLIALLDDASSRLFCRFFPGDTGVANLWSDMTTTARSCSCSLSRSSTGRRRSDGPRSNGFIERFHRTLLDEHLRLKGRRTCMRASKRCRPGPSSQSEALSALRSPTSHATVNFVVRVR